MLRSDVVPSRHFRHDYARLIGFRDYSALALIAPPAPTANPGANINAAASLRSVNYMVNHICEPIQSDGLHFPDQIARCKMGTEHRLRERRTCPKKKMITTETTSQALRPRIERIAIVGRKHSGI
jgi:hypothetical protein